MRVSVRGLSVYTVHLAARRQGRWVKRDIRGASKADSAGFMAFCSWIIPWAKEEVASCRFCCFLVDFIEERKDGAIFLERDAACLLCCMFAMRIRLVLKAGRTAGRAEEASSHGRVRNVAAIVVARAGGGRGYVGGFTRWKGGPRNVVVRSSSVGVVSERSPWPEPCLPWERIVQFVNCTPT